MQVDDSRYWREELDRIAKTLKRRRRPHRWSLRAQNVLERDLAVGFFIIRRLYENNKLSSLSHYTDIRLRSYPLKGTAGHNSVDSSGRSTSPGNLLVESLNPGTVSLLNKHRFLEKYDFTKEREESWHFIDVADRFVHGYASVPVRDSTRNWSAVYLASDRSRNSFMSCISVAVIADLFTAVVEDYPTNALGFLGPKERREKEEMERDYLVLNWNTAWYGDRLQEMAKTVQCSTKNRQETIKAVSERFSCSEGLVRRLYSHLKWARIANIEQPIFGPLSPEEAGGGLDVQREKHPEQ